MKKFITAITLLISMSIIVDAQTYQPFPTNTATWDVARCWYLFLPGWYDHYTIEMEGDTLHDDGFVYKKLYITDHQVHGPDFDSIFPTQFFGGMREADKQIFIYQKWATVDTTVHLVYDFNNTTIGDTIFTSVLAGPSTILLSHLITAVDSVLIGTQYHKRLYLQDPADPFKTEEWIEGVGSSWGLPFATFWSITDNSYDLTCFYNDQALEYVNPAPTFAFCTAPFPDIACDPIPVSIAETSPGKTFNLFPNPADDLVTLEIDHSVNMDLTLSIYDINGLLIRSESVTASHPQVNVGDLSNGIYIVSIKTEVVIESSRLVIQR